jgi:predicted aminopeptidase
VLSSMIAEGDEALGELVNVVLHESVHATLYIDGQTRFNESLAEFSADKFTVIYLDERYGAASEQKAAYEDAQRRSQERHAKFHRAYEELDRVYKSKDPDAVKLAHKKRILEALRAEVRARRHLTNATLAAFKNYNSATPEFGALLDACGGSWDRFFGSLGTLKKKGSFVKSNQADLAAVLDPLIKGGCAAP